MGDEKKWLLWNRTLMSSGSGFTLLLFPEFRVFEKDIKGRSYSDDESGQSVKEAFFPYIAFNKFSRRL
jgi:hypothetical protein